MSELPPIDESPVPDAARLLRLAAGAGPTEAELYGPPEPVLALGRWLRAAVPGAVDLAGTDRERWPQRPGSLAVEVTDEPELFVTLRRGRLVIAGSAGVIDRLGEIVQDVGVKALDWRWAPTERRATVAPVEGADPPVRAESLALHVASAYPLDPP